MDGFLKAAIIFGGGYAVLSFFLVYFLGPKRKVSTGLPTRGQSGIALKMVHFTEEIIEKHSPDDFTWAVRFLKHPHPALDDMPPIDLLATPDGRGRIEDLLEAGQSQPLEQP